MTFIQLIFVLVVLGLVWWLFSTYVLPRTPDPFRTIIVVVVILIICLVLLDLVGLLPSGPILFKHSYSIQ